MGLVAGAVVGEDTADADAQPRVPGYGGVEEVPVTSSKRLNRWYR